MGDPPSRLQRAVEADGDAELADEQSPEQDYICARIADGLYAIPVRSVAEVIAPTPPTPVPHVPEHILGVIGHQGKIRPVLDVAVFMTKPPVDAPRRLVVLYSGALEAAVPVDEIFGINTYADDRVEAALPGRQAVQPFVVGQITTEDKIYSVIDAEHLLQAARHKRRGED